ncbi:MAG TPA: endolytic transglycosylase MltG [Spirochaetota bacterium]|nr:endolytic transglycosylase MltG [Spirochaetota bacterium]HOS41138.1 endolytic transglycosylase MltG [Spirochaetota bacterium]HPI23385.1 endolytic transglycosylase MltG [Spirochaetota bacterium]HPU90037.1 endolytic transglycosylase MltG [Spirochaetota bacterium]
MTVRTIIRSLLAAYSLCCLVIAGYFSFHLVVPASFADSLVVPEGSTMRRIAERVSARTNISSRDFLSACLDMKYIRPLGIDAPSAEGYLYPDTYRLGPGVDARRLVRMMHRRFAEVVAALDARAPAGAALHELVVLASIVEKESPRDDEKPIIAGVFRNRLGRGMKLQADPTVRYALNKPRGALTMDDIRHRSRYNTYIHHGLPPGPICSPGRAALAAALRPAQTPYLYFVSRGDGSHYFSRTLDEHRRAVDYFIRGRNNGFVDRRER